MSSRLGAARALEALHERPEPALRKTDKPRPTFTPDELRGLRAVRVLGLVSTPAPRRLLRDLTRGHSELPITREAQDCLRRLSRP